MFSATDDITCMSKQKESSWEQQNVMGEKGEVEDSPENVDHDDEEGG